MAVEIADALAGPPKTISTARHVCAQHGVRAMDPWGSPGAPVRLSAAQRAESVRRAEVPPSERGLPYGRWSATKVRSSLRKQGIVKAISRAPLRRVRTKGGAPSGGSGASSSAVSPAGRPSCVACAGGGSLCHATASCAASTCHRWLSRPMGGVGTPPPHSWSEPGRSKHAGDALCASSMTLGVAAVVGPPCHAKVRRLSVNAGRRCAAGIPTKRGGEPEIKTPLTHAHHARPGGRCPSCGGMG